MLSPLPRNVATFYTAIIVPPFPPFPGFPNATQHSFDSQTPTALTPVSPFPPVNFERSALSGSTLGLAVKSGSVAAVSLLLETYRDLEAAGDTRVVLDSRLDEVGAVDDDAWVRWLSTRVSIPSSHPA